jgi:hypothetical protein
MVNARAVALAVLAMLTAAAAYYATVALRWLSVGNEPGDAPPGDGFVFTLALLALVAGAFVFAALASRPRPAADALASLVGLASAAFLVTRFYSFDPYFAPNLRRFSDGGLVAGSWIYTLVALALLAAVLVKTRPRLGLILGAPVLLLIAVTTFATGLGH